MSATHPALGDDQRTTVTTIYICGCTAGDERRVEVEDGDFLEFTDGWLHLRSSRGAWSWPASRINCVETRPA